MTPLALGVLRVERAVQLGLKAFGRRFAGRPLKVPHLETGDRGELEAMYFLRRQGYLVVERQWRSPEVQGDLDLVAWDSGTLVIVEVKTRTRRGNFPAQAAVDRGKRAMLRRMARRYRRTLPRESRWETPIRFDVVSIYLLVGQVECELARDVFSMEEQRASDARW